VDELFGFIADAIAKKLREANMPVAKVQQRVALTAAVPSNAQSAGSLARQAAADSAALDSLFAPAAVPVATRRDRSGLLAAFGGGEPLVAAFVLAEALAPPVGLREPRW